MSLWTKSWSVTIQMKATEQYFLVLLFFAIYTATLTFATHVLKPQALLQEESRL